MILMILNTLVKGIIVAKLMYGSANNAFRILHKDLGGVSLKNNQYYTAYFSRYDPAKEVIKELLKPC